jgi:hypothetical protein
VRAVLALTLAAFLALPAAAAADVRTGQSPDCKRFCISVEPREGPEGSVFRISGRGWRPDKRVEGRFTFSQWRGRPNESRLVQRRPRYRVILP